MFTIGRLAEAAGVNVETIRYYERRGLLEPPPRSAAGYRQYSDGALWRLNFIARAKELGFSLSEIEPLLVGATPSAVLAASRAKLETIVRQQRELDAVRGRLEALARLCESGDEDCATLTIRPSAKAPPEGAGDPALR